MTTMSESVTKALIVVDVQNDFCPEGSLPVAGGDKIAQKISNFMRDGGSQYRLMVATKCWHPDDEDFAHFSATPDYQDTWPPHCVQNTWGAEFHPNLEQTFFRHIFRKGETAAAYSGFEGHNDFGETLNEYLSDRGIDSVDVVGLATDYCVKATAIDAAKLGFTTTVLLNLTAGVHPENIDKVVEELFAVRVAVADDYI